MEKIGGMDWYSFDEVFGKQNRVRMTAWFTKEQKKKIMKKGGSVWLRYLVENGK